MNLAPAPVGLAQRDYQDEAVDATLTALDEGVTRQLGVAATGLGKTVIFGSVARRLGLPTLILAHRDELISQAVEKVQWAWPDARIGVVQGARNEWREDVVVASVQTISRRARLAKVPPRFGLVVVDEAHHSAADSYRRVLDWFQNPTGAHVLTLGVTATPDRGDRKGLGGIYDRVVWTYDILWGIANAWLSDLRGVRVGMDLDLSGVAVRGGDFADGQLGSALEAADAPGQVATAWRNHAAGRRGLVFCPTIALAASTAAALRSVGVSAGSVSGVDMDERRRLLAALRAGAIDVVTNCSVLTEGFDEPSIDCIVIARPTKSRSLYVQMVGRGTRRHPAKADCLVLDVVGATGQHELVTVPALFGLKDADCPADGRMTVAEAVGAVQAREAKEGRLVATEVDLFRRVQASRIAWVQAGRRYAVGAGNRSVVVLERDRTGEVWRARVLTKGEPPELLVTDTTLERAQGVGEDYVRSQGNLNLKDSRAPWRAKPPSEKQVAAAKRWRVRVTDGMTAGDLSTAIDAKVAEARIRELVRG